VNPAQHAAGATDRARDAWAQALAILRELGHGDAEEVRARLDARGHPDAVA